MNAEQFCYWLQGMFELTDSKELNEEQLGIIRKHLNLVFKKREPEMIATPILLEENDLKQTVKPPSPFQVRAIWVAPPEWSVR